jgi:D-glycero-alpha-D-manno-heptose-7-phosphate kinase
MRRNDHRSRPLRISLGGVPSYYREYGGFLIAGAIDKHVYITLMKRSSTI